MRYFLKKALKQSGIRKRVSCHTLPQSYATNLMEQGVDVRVIQGLLGDRSLKTTTLYLHITQSVIQSVQDAINDLMAELWIEQRRQELLAVAYFHVVFTLPEELRPIVRSHQKTMYGVLMKAAPRSPIKLAADPRYVGGRIGILAVLQTWTGTLTYHPHVHCLVPAGGVSRDEQWVAARKDYLVPVEALALIFRGMFLQMAGRALPRQHLPNSLWTKKWYVYCEPTVQGTERVLQYLGRYIYRLAFAKSRLVCIDRGQVTFRYQDRKKRQWKTKTLSATEFIGRFLQHVLPRGTHKVRYYAIWNPSQRCLLRRVQLVTGPLQIPSATQEDPVPRTPATPDGPAENTRKCPDCGEGKMVLVETIRRPIRAPP